MSLAMWITFCQDKKMDKTMSSDTIKQKKFLL